MRRPTAAVLLSIALGLALGCGGFGAGGGADDAVDAAPADAEAPAPVAATHGTGDTGDVVGHAPDPAPRHARARRRPRPARPPAAPGRAAPPVAPKKQKAPPTPGPKPDGIEQVDEARWRVARSLVDRWQEDPYQLGNVREKEPGWEVFGVRVKDGYHLGMRNKDVVIEVNGHQLRTKPQLLSAWLDLRNDRVFDVTLLRAGATRVHHYEVVD